MITLNTSQTNLVQSSSLKTMTRHLTFWGIYYIILYYLYFYVFWFRLVSSQILAMQHFVKLNSSIVHTLLKYTHDIPNQLNMLNKRNNIS